MHRVPAAHDQIPIRKQVVLVQLGPCNRKFTLLWWKRSIENLATAANLAACVFHAMIHRESPVGLPNRLTPSTITPNDYGLPDAGTVDVPAVDATFLQEVAWKAAEGWR